MSICNITVNVECDECGRQFSVQMDAAEVPPDGWSAFDMAVDAVRGSLDYKDSEYEGFIFSSSVQDEKQLCRRCTTDHDGQ